MQKTRNAWSFFAANGSGTLIAIAAHWSTMYRDVSFLHHGGERYIILFTGFVLEALSKTFQVGILVVCYRNSHVHERAQTRIRMWNDAYKDCFLSVAY